MEATSKFANMRFVSLPRKYVFFHDSRWASGDSCRGLTIFLHLVGGSRVPNGKDPLRGQGTEREQGTMGIGGVLLWAGSILWKLTQLPWK